MSLADPPTSVSAEAALENTIILTWITPEDDGGSTITGYQVKRELNGGASTEIEDNTGVVLTFTDSTLVAGDTAVYQIFTVNGIGTGTSGSENASATTSTSEAQTIKELLSAQWSLNGELSKDDDNDMSEVVSFLNRDQVPGNKTAKMVTVQKINEIGNEIEVEHPRFLEESEIFEISCFLQVPDSADDVFNDWIDLMQQMTTEVTRILKTVYSPSETTGEFFKTTTNWNRDNSFGFDDTMLVRTLRFMLTRIKSNDTSVFVGYGGVLTFDDSASVGDVKPSSDHIYAQVTDIISEEGFSTIPYLTKDIRGNVGVPYLARGIFDSTFTAIMYVSKDDFSSSSIEAIDNIYLPQSNSPLKNQFASVVLLQANTTRTTSTSNNARGTVTAVSGPVTALSIDNGGSSYDNNQTVSLTGRDSEAANATATVTVSEGKITGATIAENGTSYTDQEDVIITGVAASSTLTRTATLNITRLTIIDKDVDLLKCRISGKLTKVTGFVVT